MSIFALIIWLAASSADLEAVLQDRRTSLLVYDMAAQRDLIQHQINTPRVPASTLKLFTADLALEHWGQAHYFHTDFYWQGDQLWIKGYGDPWLRSEEIQYIATQLQARGLPPLKTIYLDITYFDQPLKFNGQGRSWNPYDAGLSALSANFNTVYIGRDSQGRLYSAEAETPLTAVARALGRWLKRGQKKRLPIHDSKQASRHFAQILAHFLHQPQVKIQWQKLKKSDHFYRHYNRDSLSTIVQAMLHYSNNFIANQLALMLAAEYYGAPVGFEQVAAYFAEQIEQRGWQGAQILEGAGLSRQNRLSAAQLKQILLDFRPYAELLPEVAAGIRAKSGTLKGISHYAGYIHDRYLVVLLLAYAPPDYFFRLRLLQTIADWLESNQVD